MFQFAERNNAAHDHDHEHSHDEQVAPRPRSYTVKAGDTLGKIAASQLGDAARYTEIAALNGISNPNLIDVGQQLRLPSAGASTDVLQPQNDAPTNETGKPVEAAGGAQSYTVRAGDTLAIIAVRVLGDASRFMEIATFNGIANPNLISVGQVLKVPGSTASTPPVKADSGKASTYTVLPGDTLSGIAGRLLSNQARWREIALLNGIRNPSALRIGQLLKIPDGATIVETPPKQGANDSGWLYPSDSSRLTSHYGQRVHPISGKVSHHHGLDVGAAAGSNIYAAKSGVVTHAGWAGGYGNAVYIDHGDGVETRYAHASSVTVAVGQQVSQGQVVAKVGSTGNSTGPHLHFEIRFGGSSVDPLSYVSP